MGFLEALKEWDSFGLFVAALLYGLYQKIFKKKHATIDKDVEFSIPIYNILVDILLELPAVGVFIKQFHNGNEFYSGQKIQRLSISHEKCKPGVLPVKNYHDNLQVPAEVHDIINHMESQRQDWFWSDDPRIKNFEDNFPELDTWMKLHATKSIVYLRLYDRKSGATIGLLGVRFNHKFRLDTNDDILYLTRKKKEIESEFMKV